MIEIIIAIAIAMDERIIYNGYVVFCESHNKGSILNLGMTHDEEFSEAFTYGNKVVELYSKKIGKKMGCCKSKCGIYLDGLSLNNRIVYGHNKKYYDVFFEGWKLEDVAKNAYSRNKIVSVCI